MEDVNLGTVYTSLDLNTELLYKRTEEIEAAWDSLKRGASQASLGLSNAMVEGLNRYQAKLERVALALEKQRTLIKELEALQSKPTTSASTQAQIQASVEASMRLEDEKKKLKELEAQFDSTYEAQRDFIAQQEKLAAKTAEVEKRMDLRQAGANVKAGAAMAASGLRTFDQVAPGLSRNLDNLITQINLTKQAMTGAQSPGMKWAMGISGAIGIATTIIMAGIKSMQKAEEERQKALEEGIQKNQEYVESMNTLETNLRIMQDEKSTVDQVRSAREQLASTFPDLIVGYDNEGRAILANTEQMEKYISAQKEAAQVNRQGILSGASAVKTQYEKLSEELDKAQKEFEEKVKTFERIYPNQKYEPWSGQTYKSSFLDSTYTVSLDNYNRAVLEAEKALNEFDAQYRLVIKAQIQDAVWATDSVTGLSVGYDNLSKAQKLVADSMILEYMDKVVDGSLGWKDVVEKITAIFDDPSALEAYAAQVDAISEEIQTLTEKYSEQVSAISQLQSAYQTLSQGQSLSTEQLNKMIETYPEIAKYISETGDLTLQNGEILKKVAATRQQTHIRQLEIDLADAQSTRDKTIQTVKSIESEIKALQALSLMRGAVNPMLDLDTGKSASAWTEELEKQKALLEEQDNNVETINAMLAAARSSLDGFDKSSSKSSSSRNSALAAELKRLEQRKKLDDLTYGEELAWLQQLQSKYTQNEDERMDLEARIYTAQQNLIKAEEQAVLDRYNAELAAMEQKRRMGELTYEEELRRLQELKELDKLKAEQQNDLDYKIYTAQKNMEDEAIQAASKRLNAEYRQIQHKKKMDELTSQEELEWLEQIQRQFRMNAEEKMDLQERIYELQKQIDEEEEQAATDLLNAEYKALEQKKQLGQLSGQEELEWLERIQKTFRMNKEEQMELEIKLYNLKKELHEQDVDALNNLGDAVTEALKNQYEAQQKLEEERINASVESWKQWEKDTVAAIQGQIDALDELEKQQDSSEKRAEYERKKQALTLQLTYEKDDYQRKQYQQELARLEKEEQKRLDEEAREAERKRLQQQIEDTKNSASAQEEALKKELDAIKEKYDDLTSEFALRAEAEKAIMNSTQQEIVALIQSYAPEYNLAGQTLGDKLAEGFKSKFGGIVSYVESVTNRIQSFQEMLMAQTNATVERFWAAQRARESRISAASASAAPVSRKTEINMPITFNQPVKSPIETRRAIQSVADELARQIS